MQYESEISRTAELAALTAGRTRQKGELNSFFAAVTRGASSGADSLPAAEASVYLMGFWTGFFDGLRAGRYCADLTASTLKRGRKTTSDKERSTSNDDSHGVFTSDDGEASDARARRREKARKKEGKQKARDTARRPADGGGGLRTLAGRGRRAAHTTGSAVPQGGALPLLSIDHRHQARRQVLGERHLPDLHQGRTLGRRVPGRLGAGRACLARVLGERQAFRRRLGRGEEP